VTFLVPIALLGAIPFALLMFASLPARKAVLVSFLGLWLFLPVAEYSVPGLPDYTKSAAISLSVLLGAILLDARSFSALRFSGVDLPVIVWCLCPIASSVANDLGWYDGFSNATTRALEWGVPYLLGRVYFRDEEAFRELVKAVAIGGLVYVPLCLFEARMSPILHAKIYGFHQHVWMQSQRFGGWRPTVFLTHGLSVAFFMAIATMSAFGLWRQRTRVKLLGLNVGWGFVLILVALVACKSINGWFLALAGIGMVAIGRSPLARIVWIAVLCAPLLYFGARVYSLWSPEAVVEGLSSIGLDGRSESLQTRLRSERLLADRALERPWFGWGGWARNRVTTEFGYDAAITDGFWILVFGRSGFFGLVAWCTTILLPPLILATRSRRFPWKGGAISAVDLAALFVVLHFVDSIPNAHSNPICHVAIGGVSGFAAFSAGSTRGPSFVREDKAAEPRIASSPYPSESRLPKCRYGT